MPPSGEGLLLMAALYASPFIAASTVASWAAARSLLRWQSPDAKVRPGRLLAAEAMAFFGFLPPLGYFGLGLASFALVFALGTLGFRSLVFCEGESSLRWRNAVLTAAAFMASLAAVWYLIRFGNLF